MSRILMTMDYSFCPKCGGPLVVKPVDERDRLVCSECGFIFYQNPTVGVATIITAENRVLLGRRRSGEWCIPCGFVEWGEDVREAARRELLEETGLEAEIGDVYEVHSNFHNPETLSVGIWFFGRVTSGGLLAG